MADNPKRKRAPGAGPPFLYGAELMQPYTVRLTEEQAEAIRAHGGGNLSAGVRTLYEQHKERKR